MFKPEQIKIAILRSDGGVTIMAFVTKSFRPGRDADGNKVVEFEVFPTADNINAEIAKARLDCVSWKIITDAEIPSDRTFRNAWKLDGDIVVDMPKAREIHKERLRRDRIPLLAALDVEYQMADEENDNAKKRGIAARKKVLRDATDNPAIEAALTPEQLMLVSL